MSPLGTAARPSWLPSCRFKHYSLAKSRLIGGDGTGGWPPSATRLETRKRPQFMAKVMKRVLSGVRQTSGT